MKVTGAYPCPRGPTSVCYSLTDKYKTMWVTERDKHTSLLRNVVNCSRKMFDSTGPQSMRSRFLSKQRKTFDRSRVPSNPRTQDKPRKKNRGLIVAAGNPNRRGRLSTVDLLVKVACFVTRVNNIFNITSNWSNELVQGGQPYRVFPLIKASLVAVT